MVKHQNTQADDLDLAKLREAVRLLKNCDPRGAQAVALTMSKQGRKNFINQMRKFRG